MSSSAHLTLGDAWEGGDEVSRAETPRIQNSTWSERGGPLANIGCAVRRPARVARSAAKADGRDIRRPAHVTHNRRLPTRLAVAGGRSRPSERRRLLGTSRGSASLNSFIDCGKERQMCRPRRGLQSQSDRAPSDHERGHRRHGRRRWPRSLSVKEIMYYGIPSEMRTHTGS